MVAEHTTARPLIPPERGALLPVVVALQRCVRNWMSQAEGLKPCVCVLTAYPSVQRETLRCERFNDCLSYSLAGLEACNWAGSA